LLYLRRLAFGGKVAGRNFGIGTAGPSRYDATKLGPILEDIHSRLAGVVIECLPWRSSSSATTPPGRCSISTRPIGPRRDDYGASAFTRADFVGLASGWRRSPAGSSCQSTICMRRDFFRRFAIETVATRYTVSGGKSAKVRSSGRSRASKAVSKKGADDLLARAGGSATTARVSFRASVGAVFAVQMLAESSMDSQQRKQASVLA
jgi:hypothetical protein